MYVVIIDSFTDSLQAPKGGQSACRQGCSRRLDGSFNWSPPGQNGRHFADDMFKRIFLNENIWISNKISLKYVPWGLIDNMAALVQIMAWRRPGHTPLFEPMLTQFTDAYMRHWGRWTYVGNSHRSSGPTLHCSVPRFQCRWSIPQYIFVSANQTADNTPDNTSQ